MKVLHVIETLGFGGAERLLVTLLSELTRQGIHAEVAVLRPPFDMRTELEAAGIAVHVLPERGKWQLIKAARDLAKLARKRGADILHAHLYFPTLTVALARRLWLFTGATHASFHNLAYKGANKRTWKLALRQKLARILIPQGIDQPQGVSQATADHYATAYQLNNIAVTPNAINLSLLTEFRADVGDAIVLPGRLVPEKGHLDLIIALAALKRECPPIIFAGDGPLRPRIENAISETGLPIRITGQLTHCNMLVTIAAARLVVIPSRFEGFGLAALEALALGRPVVASTAGGLPEVLGDAGRLVPPEDPATLAQAIETALEDDVWTEAQHTKGIERAKGYSAAPIAARQISLYRATLQQRARTA